MKYFDELKRSMTWLGSQEDTLFLGQAVEYEGTAMTNTLTEAQTTTEHNVHRRIGKLCP